jgi:Arc/MetJ-type ribon-helix-helix transcriptional regulator
MSLLASAIPQPSSLIPASAFHTRVFARLAELHLRASATTILPMPKLTAEIPSELSRQIDRIIRDGWFPDQDAVVREALLQFVDAKSFLGDSPRMLHRFAADALNDSKPEVALKFVSRALSMLSHQQMTDFTLYQALVELRVQVLLVLGREDDALACAEEAREKMPNNPTIAKWIEKLQKSRPRGEA